MVKFFDIGDNDGGLAGIQYANLVFGSWKTALCSVTASVGCLLGGTAPTVTGIKYGMLTNLTQEDLEIEIDFSTSFTNTPSLAEAQLVTVTVKWYAFQAPPLFVDDDEYEIVSDLNGPAGSWTASDDIRLPLTSLQLEFARYKQSDGPATRYLLLENGCSVRQLRQARLDTPQYDYIRDMQFAQLTQLYAHYPNELYREELKRRGFTNPALRSIYTAVRNRGFRFRTADALMIVTMSSIKMVNAMQVEYEWWMWTTTGLILLAAVALVGILSMLWRWYTMSISGTHGSWTMMDDTMVEHYTRRTRLAVLVVICCAVIVTLPHNLQLPIIFCLAFVAGYESHHVFVMAPKVAKAHPVYNTLNGNNGSWSNTDDLDSELRKIVAAERKRILIRGMDESDPRKPLCQAVKQVTGNPDCKRKDCPYRHTIIAATDMCREDAVGKCTRGAKCRRIHFPTEYLTEDPQPTRIRSELTEGNVKEPLAPVPAPTPPPVQQATPIIPPQPIIPPPLAPPPGLPPPRTVELWADEIVNQVIADLDEGAETVWNTVADTISVLTDEAHHGDFAIDVAPDAGFGTILHNACVMGNTQRNHTNLMMQLLNTVDRVNVTVESSPPQHSHDDMSEIEIITIDDTEEPIQPVLKTVKVYYNMPVDNVWSSLICQTRKHPDGFYERQLALPKQKGTLQAVGLVSLGYYLISLGVYYMPQLLAMYFGLILYGVDQRVAPLVICTIYAVFTFFFPRMDLIRWLFGCVRMPSMLSISSDTHLFSAHEVTVMEAVEIDLITYKHLCNTMYSQSGRGMVENVIIQELQAARRNNLYPHLPWEWLEEIESINGVLGPYHIQDTVRYFVQELWRKELSANLRQLPARPMVTSV